MNVKAHGSPPGWAWDPHCGTGRTCWGGEPAASGPGGWVTVRAEVGCLPERLSTASFTILRREAEVSVRGSERRVGPTSV